MRYLLLTHVPLYAGKTPGTYQIGDLWREDLLAQRDAIRAVGGRLLVATEFDTQADLYQSGSFNFVQINPAEEDMEYYPLPVYKNYRGYLRVRSRLKADMLRAMRQCDIVQLDYGGFSMSLGQSGWPVAGRAGCKRIWLFDGADPFPRLRQGQRDQKNMLIGAVKKILNDRFLWFCRQAVREADLVFAHNQSVVERFAGQWGPHCHAFDRSFVTDSNLLDTAALERRRSRLADPARPLRIVCAHRQQKIKGTNHVIAAVQLARSMGVRLQLDVIGDGEDLDSFRRQATEAGLAEVVRFRGTVPYGEELFAAWGESDLIAVTNLTAEISRNVLLGGARGLPIVTYSNPGTDRMLRDADAAEIVPVGDIARLAAALVRLSRDRARLAELLANGHRLAASKTLQQTHARRAQLAMEVVHAGGSRRPPPG